MRLIRRKEQPSCLLSSMNQQMSSDFSFSKVLTSFLKMFLDGLQKNMLLLVGLRLVESSEEDSSRRFPNKPGVDLGPTSNDEVLDFKTKVSDGWEEAQDLLRKNHTLRLEIDALKRQHREKEENYSEDMEILKGKNDDLQKAIKLSEETLTKTVSHYTRQLNALTAENRMLTFKLENEKESKQRLETEVKSYRSRLAAASRDHDQGQTSQRDLELAFQRARDKWLCLQGKMKSDMANLNDVAETFSQKPSVVESKLNKLKIKLQHMKDDLREKTLMLERVQRDLSQSVKSRKLNTCIRTNTPK